MPLRPAKKVGIAVEVVAITALVVMLCAPTVHHSEQVIAISHPYTGMGPNGGEISFYRMELYDLTWVTVTCNYYQPMTSWYNWTTSIIGINYGSGIPGC